MVRKKAEQMESIKSYDDDSYIMLQGERQAYRIRKSQMPRLVEITADYVERWINEQKYLMNEEQYLLLLCEYNRMINVNDM
jgi:hypothetical protein